MKYIDSEKLIAEIRKLCSESCISESDDYYEYAKSEIIDIITSLQQEQPEVDLEEAARHVYESWMGGTMDDVRRDMAELGKVLNARKEE